MLISTLLAGTIFVVGEKPAEVFPRSVADIRVFSTNKDGDLGVGNDTFLFLSAEIATMGASGQVVQPHVPDQLQFVTHPDAIGPQGSFFSGYSETTKAFTVPDGRNSTVSIITPGFERPGSYLTDAELALSRRLWERTIFENVAIPAFLFCTGLAKGSINEPLRKALIEAFTHNTKLLESIRDDVYSVGSTKNLLKVIIDIMVREIETGGLAKDFVIDGAKVTLPKLLERQLIKWGIANVHPALRAAQLAILFLDKGPDVIQVSKTVSDLRATPIKLVFKAFFESELSEVSPTHIVPSPIDQTFVLVGYQMYHNMTEPMVITFTDQTGKRSYSSVPDWVLPNGSQAGITVSKEFIRSAASPLTVWASFGGKLYTAPQKVYIGSQLDAPRISPQPASVNEPIEIYSPDISKYLLNNIVYIGDKDYNDGKKAPIERVADGYIIARVPNLPPEAPPGGYRLWIEREEGRTQFRSKLSDFKLDPIPYEEKLKRQRDRFSPESTEIFEGVLSPSNPIVEHIIEAQSGVQVLCTLTEVYGDSGSDPYIKKFSLDFLSNHATSAAQSRVPAVTPLEHIRGTQPMAILTHTASDREQNGIYKLKLEYESGGNLRFKVKIEYVLRDDAGAGHDASALMSRPTLIHTGQNYTGYLFGHELKMAEDRLDHYLIPNVQAGQKIKLQILDIKGHLPQDVNSAALAGLYISRIDDVGSARTVASFIEPINYQTAHKELFYEDPSPGDYLVSIRHGIGNVEYLFKVDVGFDFGPDPYYTPIKSLFDAGNNEQWKLAFSGRPLQDAHWTGKVGDGYISPLQMHGPRTGPLDLAFVIDATNSMRPIIDSVKAKSNDIVQGLATYSKDFHLGVTFFGDVEAEGLGNAIRTAPVSTNPLNQLQTMATWASMSGGTDSPEDLLLGLRTALDQTWRTGPVGKAIVFFTDSPAKLNTNGADGQGNTIASIIALAKKKGIQLIPVPTTNDADLWTQCNRLASSTGGKVIPFTEAENIVPLLTGIVGQSIERALPAYWIAPQAFLGDNSRFYGRSLTFLLSSPDFENAFDADDVILSNGEISIGLRSTLRPRGAGFGPGAENWSEVTIPLSTSANWKIVGANRFATRSEIVSVLSKLSELKIRAEFYGGDDASYLDKVILGSTRQLTDRGLTETGEVYAQYITRSIEAIERRWNSSFSIFLSAPGYDDWLFRNLDGTGITREDLYMYEGAQLRNALRDYSGRGAEYAYLKEMRVKLYRWLDQIRYRGELTPEQFKLITDSIVEWNTRMAKLDTDYAEYKKEVVSLVKAHYAFDQANRAASANVFDLLQTFSECERRVNASRDRIVSSATPIFLPSP